MVDTRVWPQEKMPRSAFKTISENTKSISGENIRTGREEEKYKFLLNSFSSGERGSCCSARGLARETNAAGTYTCVIVHREVLGFN